MTKDLIAFEWRYHTRQPSFIGACLLFLIFGFALSASGFGPDNLAVNSPFIVMESVGLLSLLSVFVLAVFSANAVVRDREHRMEEIVFSTAVEKMQFLASRFAGSFLAAFTAFSVCIVGLLAGTLLISHDPSRLAPLQVGHYLWALLVMALPNLLLAAILLFAIATLTRSLLASSVGAVLIYVVYFAVSAWTNSPLMASSVPGGENLWFVSLFDPFGLSAFFEQTRYWTPVERNSRLTTLSGVFLANRLLWLGMAAVGWAIVHRLFKFGVLVERRTKAEKPDVLRSAAASPPLWKAVAAPPHSEAPIAAFLSTTRLEVRSYLKTLTFLALTLLWAALAFSEIAADLGSGEYGSMNYATTGLVLGAMQQALPLIVLIVLTWFSTEMLWRERTLRMDGILNATPTPSVTFVLSKWAALSLLTLVLIGTGIAAGVLYQLARGYAVIDWALIAKFAWFNGAPLVLFAMVAVLVHTVSPHKYLGMMIVLLLAILMRQATLGGSFHHLWAFGSAPPVAWTAMNGFGPYAAPFNRYMLHWAVVGALLLTIAAAFWRRSRTAFKPFRLILGVLLLAAVASGAHILYNTNVLNTWESASSRRAWRGDYEKTYGRFAALRQPRIVAIESRVDFFPAEGRYAVRGSYVLRNDTAESIDRVLVGVARDARHVEVSMPGAKVVSTDSRFGHTWLQLEQPLAPGGTTNLLFDVAFGSRGFSDQGPDTAVLANGSFFIGARVFPAIGYRKRNELTDPADRRKEGLPPKTIAPEEVPEVVDWVTTDLTVSTAPDQIAITSGRLARQWTEGGRRYFRYVSDGPIPNGVAFASARYSVARSAYRGIPIEIYHHPAHAFNVPRMLETAKASLEYFEKSFGPYPHRQLKIVETSPPEFSGQARPDIVFLGEKRGFLIDVRDRGALDLVARRLSHEIAHQWWGGYLVPANRPGATVLVESLTKYAELLVLEQMQGRDALRRSLTYELDLYLSGRADESGAEPPLARAGGQSYLYYRKGAIVMNAIEELLGEAALNQAIRAFMAEQGGPGRNPTATRLIDHLRSAATPAQQALIDEWMTQVVLYDLRVESARSRPLGNGRFEVTIEVRASKTTKPLQEELEIALFELHPDRTDAKDNVIYAAKHAIHDGANTITVIVNRQPGVAAVDPNILRIDSDRFDNFKDVAR